MGVSGESFFSLFSSKDYTSITMSFPAYPGYGQMPYYGMPYGSPYGSPMMYPPYPMPYQMPYDEAALALKTEGEEVVEEGAVVVEEVVAGEDKENQDPEAQKPEQDASIPSTTSAPSTAAGTRPGSPATLANTPNPAQAKTLEAPQEGDALPPVPMHQMQQMYHPMQMMYPMGQMGYPMHPHPYGHPHPYAHPSHQTPSRSRSPSKGTSEKRKRTQLPESSLTLLQNAFLHNKFPSPTQRNEIAVDLSITPKVVQSTHDSF